MILQGTLRQKYSSIMTSVIFKTYEFISVNTRQSNTRYILSHNRTTEAWAKKIRQLGELGICDSESRKTVKGNNIIVTGIEDLVIASSAQTTEQRTKKR